MNVFHYLVLRLLVPGLYTLCRRGKDSSLASLTNQEKNPKSSDIGDSLSYVHPLYANSHGVCLFVCLFVLGPHLWYMEAPRLGLRAAAASLTQPQQHGIQVAYVTISQLMAMLDT